MGDAPSVVVVGSGAAGMAAALAAAGAGADVVVLERADTVGGTTAVSGGVVWLPAHGRGRGASPAGDRRDALTYLCALVEGDGDPAMLEAFVADAARVAEEVERRTPLQWEVLEHWPDYRGELPGASPGGRSLWPRPLRLPAELERRIQPALDQPTPGAGGAEGDGAAPANDAVVLRGHVRGRALCGGLLAGALDAGVEVRTGVRARHLALDGDGVVGVETDGEVVRGRVVMASGGFQHDALLASTHLPGPVVAPMGPAGCGGDGVRMAEAAGAALGNMGEGWWMPAMHVPGEEFGGVPHFRPLHGERAKPGAVMVGADGRRFVDEARSYGDVGRAMRRAGTGPFWMLFDAAYRRRYPVGPLDPEGPDPAWLVRADDLAALAAATGLPADALAATVARFNDGARRAEDADFDRGMHPYDVWIGDAEAPHPTLAPLDEAPFYALEVHLGCLGTRGGPRTDARGRVLATTGAVIPGLYAAGNAAASPFAGATAAGGATLGPALVFGFRAGEAAAGER